MVGGTARHDTAVADQHPRDPMGNDGSQHCLRAESDQSHPRGAFSGLRKSAFICALGSEAFLNNGARTAGKTTTAPSMETMPASKRRGVRVSCGVS